MQALAVIRKIWHILPTNRKAAFVVENITVSFWSDSPKLSWDMVCLWGWTLIWMGAQPFPSPTVHTLELRDSSWALGPTPALPTKYFVGCEHGISNRTRGHTWKIKRAKTDYTSLLQWPGDQVVEQIGQLRCSFYYHSKWFQEQTTTIVVTRWVSFWTPVL